MLELIYVAESSFTKLKRWYASLY